MKYSRSLVATLLMSGGLLQLAPLALAGGTTAGASIDNTANATYEDPNVSGTINTTSNTVSVVVAEVAGLTVTGSGITSTTGGTVVLIPGNPLYYNFTITNTGNSPTKIHLPGVASVGPTGTLNTGASPSGMEYSTNGGTSWALVPVAGLDTPATVGINGTVLVRVAVTINSNPGTTLDVRLGNGSNTGISEVYSPSGSNDDVYTTGTAPVNGPRESSAIVSGTIGSTAQNVAFATVLATRTSENQNNTGSKLDDDIINYELALRVENSAPSTATGITAAALAGTDIKVDSSTTSKRILVSNAVPVGTTLQNTPSTAPGWTKVYTIDPTTGAGAVNANAASWTTTYTAGATRVGFVSTVGAVVAQNTTVNNFTFAVKVNTIADVIVPPATTATPVTTYTVNSIAQAFGSTSGGSDLIYDESGDQTPNNYDATKPTITSTFSTTDPVTSTVTYTAGANGVAVATYSVDGNNNNSGTASPDGRGEINKYTYIYAPALATSVLNGPNGSPDAIGPNGTTNDSDFDFTNKSASVPANIVAGTLTTPAKIPAPAAVGFTNTVKNTGTAIANISLVPEALNATSLPDGTQVTIYGAAGQSATYTSTGGVFTFTSGVGSSTSLTVDATHPALSASVPVVLESVAATVGTANYTVSVKLPNNTELSTDNLKGYPVVIKAAVATINAATGAVTSSATATNKTIDRVYTGFVKLSKETRLVQGTGPVVSTADGTFSITSKKPAAGNIIEYRITYKNISEAQVGAGNSVLKAKNLVITEDGTIGSNTWAKDADGNGIIDTSHVSSPNDGDIGGTVTFFTGATGGTSSIEISGQTVTSDVTKYVDTVTTVIDPGVSGSFSFQRKLN
jgi:hypothetical protein